MNAADVHKVLTDYYAGETFVPVRPLSDRKWLSATCSCAPTG